MDNEEYPKYKGVRLRKWGKWVSEIRLPNSRERIWLGSFDSPEKAARAFDAALYCLRGPDAAFNFPLNPPEIPGGRSMSPPEIQAAARRFANEQPHGNNQASEEMNSSRGEIDDSGGGPNGPTGEEMAVVNNINANTTTTTMDWSFLSTLETVEMGPAGFGYFHDDVANGFYQQPDGGPDPTSSSFYDGGGNDDSFGDEDFSNHSFLWNF